MHLYLVTTEMNYADGIVYGDEDKKKLLYVVLVNCLMFEAVYVTVPQSRLRWPRRFSTDSTTKPLPSPIS
jgi:hypothetical protein